MVDKDAGLSFPKRLLKRLVSRGAGLFPNTFFYGEELRTKFNGLLDREKSTDDGEKMSPLGQAAMMMSVACSERMAVGDTLTATMHGVTYSGNEKGSYRVTVERIV